MDNYIIHRSDKKRKLISKEKEVSTYIMKPKLKKRETLLDIESIYIIDKSIQKNVCNTQFKRAFKRLTSITMDSMDGSETSEGDCLIALGEVEKAKLKIIDEYKNYLSKIEVKQMLKKLDLLEEQLRNYLLQYKIHKEMMEYMMKNELKEERGKSR